MKVKHIAGLLIAVVLAAGVALLLTSGNGQGDRESVEGKVRKGALLKQKGASGQAIRLPKPGTRKGKSGLVVKNRGKRVDAAVWFRRPTDNIFRDENGKPYPQQDQKVMGSLRRAIDEDDLELARQMAAAAMGNSNVELRGMAVEVLGWFGEDAIAELTPFLSDANPEIAERAHDEWMNAVQTIEADAEKAGVIELALMGLKDRDMIEDVANELVGIDELSAVQVIANGLEEGANANAKTALSEVYETLTGDEWSGIDAAEAWLQENYEQESDEEPAD